MRNLQKGLQYLKDKHNLKAVKSGTEVEAMTFEEIYILRRVSRGIVPLTVKIGGAEARNDISFMLDNGIDCILAPMIESPYALKNFVETVEKLARPKNINVSLAVNIETIFSFYNLNRIFESPQFARIGQVTVGRSDLSGSMERDVDDEEVTHITREIIDLARHSGKNTSVGGQVSTGNASLVQQRLHSDYINTRHMVVDLKSEQITDDIYAVLAWEKALYSYLLRHFPEREAFYKDRINSVDARMGQELATREKSRQVEKAFASF